MEEKAESKLGVEVRILIGTVIFVRFLERQKPTIFTFKYRRRAKRQKNLRALIGFGEVKATKIDNILMFESNEILNTGWSVKFDKNEP